MTTSQLWPGRSLLFKNLDCFRESILNLKFSLFTLASHLKPSLASRCLGRCYHSVSPYSGYTETVKWRASEEGGAIFSIVVLGSQPPLKVLVTQRLLLDGSVGIWGNLMQVCSSSVEMEKSRHLCTPTNDHVTYGDSAGSAATSAANTPENTPEIS